MPKALEIASDILYSDKHTGLKVQPGSRIEFVHTDILQCKDDHTLLLKLIARFLLSAINNRASRQC